MARSYQLRYLRHVLALSSGFIYSASAWAQSAAACQISVDYLPVAAPAPVPSLTGSGLLVLGGAFAVLAWRHRRKTGVNRLMAVGLMSGAALFAAMGGDSLVSAVKAAAPYEFSNPSGGSVIDTSIPFASPPPVINITNTSGRRIKITSNGNLADTGTCTAGSELAVGASCTTQAVCPITMIAQAPPTLTCDMDNRIGYYAKDNSMPVSSDNNWSVFAPKIDTPPAFNPAAPGISTAITFVQATNVPIYVGGYLSNAPELTSVGATITSTSPPGYIFGDTQTNTMSWEIPIDYCWSQSTEIT